MSNPYSTGTWMPDFSKTILPIAGMVMNRQSHLDDIDMRKQALQQAANQFNVTSAEAARGHDLTAEGQNLQAFGNRTPQPGAMSLKQQELMTKTDPDKMIFNPSDMVKINVATQKKFGKAVSDALKPVFEYGNSIAEKPTSTRADALVNMKGVWPQLREEVLNNLKKVDPSKLSMQEQEQFYQYMDAITYDKTGELHLDKGFFSNTAKAIQDREANTRAALQANKPDFSHNVIEVPTPDGKSAQKFQYNTVTKQYDIPIGTGPYLVKSQVPNVNVKVNAPDNNQVETLARGILDGSVDPNGISKRGNLQGSVWTRVKEIDPTFNIVKAGAGAKFESASPTMQTKALLNAIDPLLDNLKKAGEKLTDTGSPALNAPMQWAQKNILPDQLGGVDVTAFDNLRDDTIAEVERGLLNTGVLSDSKYLRAVKNLNTAQTQKQRMAAIDNIKIVIKARLESLASGPNAPAQGGTPQRRATDKTDDPLGIRR
ncbi:MAG: hypothetical protein WC637_00015 [Victivallales bacterium]|jgi:hypothetical protein